MTASGPSWAAEVWEKAQRRELDAVPDLGRAFRLSLDQLLRRLLRFRESPSGPAPQDGPAGGVRVTAIYSSYWILCEYVVQRDFRAARPARGRDRVPHTDAQCERMEQLGRRRLQAGKRRERSKRGRVRTNSDMFFLRQLTFLPSRDLPSRDLQYTTSKKPKTVIAAVDTPAAALTKRSAPKTE